LNNIGNTCFFNSVLQLLYQCTILNKLLLSNKFDGEIVPMYTDFVCKYNSSSTSFSPTNIIHLISSKLNRSSNSQEDAEQYLNFLIDNITDELVIFLKKNNYDNICITKNITTKRLIFNLFTLNIIKTIQCPNCNFTSSSNDNINKLYLSITKNNISLQELIHNYLYDQLDNDNQWKCDKCKKSVNAIINKKIVSMPKYLIIVIKRYNNNNQKNNIPVNMPIALSINNLHYCLRGIILHSGSTNGGHYTYYGNNNNVWMLYNDSSVNICADIDNIKNNGYIYLYVNK